MSHLAPAPFGNQPSAAANAQDLPSLSKFEELTGLIGEAAADPSFASLALTASRNLRAAARQVLTFRLSQVADQHPQSRPVGYNPPTPAAPPSSQVPSHRADAQRPPAPQQQQQQQQPQRGYGPSTVGQPSPLPTQTVPMNSHPHNTYQFHAPPQSFIPTAPVQTPRYPIPLPVAPQQPPPQPFKPQPPVFPQQSNSAVVASRPESAAVSKRDNNKESQKDKPIDLKAEAPTASKSTAAAPTPSTPAEAPKPRTYDATVPHLYQKTKGEYRMARGSAESQHAPNLLLKTKQDLDDYLAKHPGTDTQLRVLDATQFKNLTPEQLLKVGEKAPFLAQVTLGYNTGLKTKTIETFCQLCPYIESFDLKGVPIEQGTFESRVVPSLPRLKYVDIRDTPAGRALAGWPTSKIEKHFRRPSLLIDL